MGGEREVEPALRTRQVGDDGDGDGDDDSDADAAASTPGEIKGVEMEEEVEEEEGEEEGSVMTRAPSGGQAWISRQAQTRGERPAESFSLGRGEWTDGRMEEWKMRRKK
ncbi:hypothetical protein G7046_g9576 [Stylonectria norvegica]|nr:hypothetical protein G7046_g9576 [Stylonectria norvegica]